MNPLFQRLSLITGKEVIDALLHTHVFVFGVGGVGSWCAEALVRSGVGSITLVDSDLVCVTNINRQVQATMHTVGAVKVEALKTRLLEINPHGVIEAKAVVFSKERASDFDFVPSDYIIDAIDSLGNKLDLIELALKAGSTLYSSMGMAQKLDPTQIRTADIWESSNCALARLVRQGLRKRGFTRHFTVVYSPEKLPLHREIEIACGSGACLCPNPCGEAARTEWCSSKKVINGSAVMVTAAAGMILASLVVQDIYRKQGVQQ
ncbi:tRNA threonylcarbamoyladenosine dehydratase [Spirochaetia bacterium]|nr:tRNA threonylcarbamoyladenosine dehydratase [Spirochaetia bacterium]